MEKKFYTDDFEQFLKETADDFRMYPSKRVWNSLYNNLHPGRKWPSLAVCLLLVSSIIFIGLSHKNEITGSANFVKKDVSTTPLIAYQDQSNSKVKESLPAISAVKNTVSQFEPSASVNVSSVTNIQSKKQVHSVAKDRITTNIAGSTINNNNETPGQVYTAVINNKFSRSVKGSTAIQLTSAIAEDNSADVVNKNNNPTLEKNIAAIPLNDDQKAVEISLIGKLMPVVTIPSVSTAKNNKNIIEKEWIEDYAFHNQPAPTLKSKLQYQLYITPSVGFRTLTQTAKYNAPARPSLVTSVPDGPNPLQHNAAFNLEAGYTYIYAYSKSMHIKAGLQVNFTNYRIHAHELGHSTYTNLVLNDPYSPNGIALSQRSTNLVNLTGNYNDKKLNSSTFQLSLPLGADIRFAGKHNLQWFVGATIQPTYVLFGNAYLVSSDSRNYVYDSKFLRKWNLNAGVEAFVSYKTKKGITFNAGPQFRYQFLSTYKEKYSFDEKLYNVGIKLGITRNF